MKNIIVIILSMLLFSCASSSDVIRSGFLQKRKYKKGYSISLRKKETRNKTSEIKEELVVQDSKNKRDEKKIVGVEINTKEDENEPELYASVTQSELKIESLIKKIEKSAGIEVLNTEEKKEKFNSLVDAISEEEENEVVKSGNYTMLLVLGVLVSLFGIGVSIFLSPVFIPIFILGALILFLTIKFGKNKVNRSTHLKVSSIIALSLFLAGSLIGAGIISLLDGNDFFDTTDDNFVAIIFLGLLGLVVLIAGLVFLGLIIGFLFRSNSK